MWRATDPQGNEAAKVRYDIVRYTRGVVLDLGCGPYKAFPHFLGVDSCKDTELFGIKMRPDLPIDAADPVAFANSFHDDSCDAIFSSHLLEHVEDYRATLAAWWKVLKVGGYLCLYLPHRDLYPRIGTEGSNPDHKHDFAPGDIEDALRAFATFDLVVNETRDQGTEYSFLQVYQKIESPDGCHECRYSYVRPRPEKTACVVRHGGIGDQIQASALLPELKRQGYHVTLLTTPKGREILEHDPHVDDWFMVDKDQVPLVELPAFWKAIAKRYDKFINLNESVEGTFLPAPGRAAHLWPQPLRHKMLNVNYAEFAADLAELPFKAEARFYPTKDEEAWADGYLAALQQIFAPDWVIGMRAEPVYAIMFVLSGSSPHKFTPHMDAVMNMVLHRLARAVFILVGDEVCRMLEAGWHPEDEMLPAYKLRDRVRCESGKLGIRKVLALAQKVDCVIGPETGVLNAVANETDVKKVVMLSHSSHENLTKHWANTSAVAGVAPCYPCHRLHIDSEFCNLDPESHAAACQQGVNPVHLYAPIDTDYTGWARVQMMRSAA